MGDDPATTAQLLRRRAREEFWIPASGSSMEPEIPEGTRVRVAASERGPRIGEVWLFVSGAGVLLVHRYLRRTRSGRFVFVGDAAPRADRPVPSEWLVGRVVEIDGSEGRRRLRRRSAVGPLTRAVATGVGRRLRRRHGR